MPHGLYQAPAPPPLAHQAHDEAQLRQEQYEQSRTGQARKEQGYYGQQGQQQQEGHRVGQSQGQEQWAAREEEGGVTWAEGQGGY